MTWQQILLMRKTRGMEPSLSEQFLLDWGDGRGSGSKHRLCMYGEGLRQ